VLEEDELTEGLEEEADEDEEALEEADEEAPLEEELEEAVEEEPAEEELEEAEVASEDEGEADDPKLEEPIKDDSLEVSRPVAFKSLVHKGLVDPTAVPIKTTKTSGMTSQ
jgi:hypothetical protein